MMGALTQAKVGLKDQLAPLFLCPEPQDTCSYGSQSILL